MNAFDEQLRDGLTADDKAFLESLEDEPGLLAQLGAAFSGPMRFWTGFAFVFSLALFALALWAVWRASGSEDLKTVLLWLTLGGWAFLAVGLTKIWFWLRLNHLQTLRELKIISVQLAQRRD